MRKNLTIILTTLFLLAGTASAQTYCGPRQFDGVHKNEIHGFLAYGNNVVSGRFFTESARYTRHLTDRWSISGSQQIQFFKQQYSVDVMGTFRIPIRRSNLYLDARILYNRWNQWHTNEFIFNISASYEWRYADIRWGWSLIQYNYHGMKAEYRSFSTNLYTEPLVMTLGIGVNIRPRENWWNLGFFIRNYDAYYYENWNINWGLRGYARLTDTMRLYGEFNIRPAGSLSQLATRYETSLKVGLKYVW